MNKSKMIILVFLFALIIPMFAGCVFKYPQDRVIGVTVSCYAIPGGYQGDPHLAYAKAIETDDFGRTLYAIENMAGYAVAALCIAQKTDESFVYYYDNVCYVYTDEYKQYSAEDMEHLKRMNDWNKPLAEEKMTKRERNGNDLRPKMNYGNMLGDEYVLNTFIKYVPVPQGCHAFVLICDKSTTGQELYLASFFESVTEKGYTTRRTREPLYFVIFNSDGTYNEETFISEIKDFKNNNNELAEFKEKNNWE